MAILTSIVAITMATAGCTTTGDAATAIEGQFDLLERTQLQGFWNDDRCRFISYADESYSSESFECSVGDLPAPGRLTDEANATIDMIDTAFNSAGLTISYILISPNPDGTIGRGSYFVKGRCDAYTYDPGWTRLPEPPEIEPGAATAINRDWYLIDYCA